MKPLEWILNAEAGLHSLKYLVVVVLRSPKKCTILNFSFEMLEAVQAILCISANPVMETQPQTLVLGCNMSSVVTVPIFGKTFAKMEQCEPFEV